MYTNQGSWLANVGQPLVSVGPISNQVCNVDRQANREIVISFVGEGSIPPGGYLQTNTNGDSLVSINRSTWQNHNFDDDFSKAQEAGNSVQTRSDSPYFVVEVDGVPQCEFKSFATQDTLGGKSPCEQNHCDVTQTTTPTPSKTVTPTESATSAPSPTASPTETPSHTVTPVQTQSPGGAASELLPIEVWSSDDGSPVSTNSPHLRLFVRNRSGNQVSLTDLRLSYWFKSSPGIYNAHVDWAGILPQGSSVQPSLVNAEVKSTSLNDQNLRLSISFDAGSGVLGPGQSLELALRFNEANWLVQDQLDDYSFLATQVSTANDKVCAYLGPDLVWGAEPGSVYDESMPIDDIARLRVGLAVRRVAGAGNKQHLAFELENLGCESIELSRMTLRLWLGGLNGAMPQISAFPENLNILSLNGSQLGTVSAVPVAIRTLTTPLVCGSGRNASYEVIIGFRGSISSLPPNSVIAADQGLPALTWGLQSGAIYDPNGDFSSIEDQPINALVENAGFAVFVGGRILKEFKLVDDGQGVLTLSPDHSSGHAPCNYGRGIETDQPAWAVGQETKIQVSYFRQTVEIARANIELKILDLAEDEFLLLLRIQKKDDEGFVERKIRTGQLDRVKLARLLMYGDLSVASTSLSTLGLGPKAVISFLPEPVTSTTRAFNSVFDEQITLGRPAAIQIGSNAFDTEKVSYQNPCSEPEAALREFTTWLDAAVPLLGFRRAVLKGDIELVGQVGSSLASFEIVAEAR